MTIFDHWKSCECCRLSGQRCADIFWVKFEDLAVLLTAENVVYNFIRIQLRRFGIARLKGRMSGLCVVTAVTAVSSPRFWVTLSALTTGVLSNSLSVSASSSWLPGGSIILPPHILEKSRHHKWVILGFSSYCFNWQCFNRCVFVYVCVFAPRWPSW